LAQWLDRILTGNQPQEVIEYVREAHTEDM
jgi:hypothetical protein